MKKTPILFVCAAMMLTGCSGATATIKDKDETIMTIGDTKYTKGDEYELLKISTGSDLTMELVKQAIYKQEVKVTKEMKEKAQEQVNNYKENMENFDKQIHSLGYKNSKQYMNKVLIPSLQASELTEKYFTDAKKDIQKTYKPSKARIIQCENKATAKKALKALKNGTDPEEVIHAVKTECCSEEGQTIRCYYGKKEEVLHLNLHKHQLAVDKIQTFLDKYLKDNSGCIDYIHGEDVLKELSKQEQTIGIELPAMEKDQLFPSVMTDGTLPRKTFSMGHACEKRYYIEGRKIQR